MQQNGGFEQKKGGFEQQSGGLGQKNGGFDQQNSGFEQQPTTQTTEAQNGFNKPSAVFPAPNYRSYDNQSGANSNYGRPRRGGPGAGGGGFGQSGTAGTQQRNGFAAPTNTVGFGSVVTSTRNGFGDATTVDSSAGNNQFGGDSNKAPNFGRGGAQQRRGGPDGDRRDGRRNDFNGSYNTNSGNFGGGRGFSGRGGNAGSRGGRTPGFGN